MELQLINELSESRLFRSIDKYQEYTLKDIAELTYLYILILELFRTTKHENFAQKYVKDTIRFNNFHSFKFSANDLYHFSHLLVGDDNERSLDRLKDASHKTNLDFMHYRKFLRDIAAGRFDEAFDKRYLLKLERELGIKNSNLKAIRRMVTNWIVQNDVSMAKSAATKLLLELRKRALKSELRMELEKFGRLDEYKLIKTNINLKFGEDIDVYQNPSHKEFLSLLKSEPIFRGLVDFETGYLYVWDASLAIHENIGSNLGINTSMHLYFSLDIGNLSRFANRFNEIFIQGGDRQKDSKFLKRALGVKEKIDEYKMIKIQTQMSQEFIVFQNPSHKEFISLLNKHKELRGIIDKLSNLYVWSAMEAVHFEVEEELGVMRSSQSDKEVYDNVYFANANVRAELLLQEYNGIWFGSYKNAQIEDYKDSKFGKFLLRAVGFKLNEYKMIKIDTRLPYNSRGKDYLIFKNPTGQELEQLLIKWKELRGSVDLAHNIYIWDAWNAVHMDAQNDLYNIDLPNIKAGDFKNDWDFDFVFSMGDTIDKFDWEGLEKIGNYYYGDEERVRVDQVRNKFLIRIFNYLKKSKINEYKMIKTLQSLIFKNPTRQEFLALLNKTGEMRGLVDINQNLYVWNANDAIHRQIENDLIDITFYDRLFFANKDYDEHEWDLEDINGISFGSYGEAINDSPHLKKVLGV